MFERHDYRDIDVGVMQPTPSPTDPALSWLPFALAGVAGIGLLGIVMKRR